MLFRSGANKVYDGTAAATIAATSGNIVVGDLVSLSASGEFSGTGAKNVGTGKSVAIQSVTMTGADAGNYLLASSTGSTTADITAKPVTVSYTGNVRAYDGGTSATVTRTASGFIAGDSVSVTEAAIFAGSGAKNVGTGKLIQITGISLAGTDAANYSLSGSTAVTTGGITPRPLNITGLSGITATDRVYDGTIAVAVNIPTSVGSASGDVIAGDDVTVNTPSSGLGSATMLTKHAGQNKAVVLGGLFLSGADAPNYAITGTAGLSVNIAPKSITITGVSATDRAYDGGTTVAINSSGGSIGGAIAGDDLQLLSSGVTGSMADKSAGQAKAVTVNGLSLGGSDVANYTVAAGSGLTVNIARRALTPAATFSDKVYDGTVAATAAFSDDRVAGDALSLAGSASFTSANAGNGLGVSVSSLSLAGADAANYLLSLSSISGSASIQRANLSIAARNLSKVYGDTINLGSSDFSALGLVVGESLGQVALTSNGAAAAAPVAGSPYVVTVGTPSGGTFNPLNYNLSLVNGQIQVTPRPLTVASSSVVRFFDEPNPSVFGFSTQGGGLTNGDTIASVLQTAPAGSATAPGGAIFELLPSGAAFGSGAASNYALSYSSGWLVVLPKPPRIGDVDAGSAGTGNVNFAILVSPSEVRRAQAELERAAASAEGGSSAAGTPTAQASIPTAGALTTAQITALLLEEGRRPTLPELQKMPLISLDPQLRRLILASDATAAP